ncbi:hypothetical protein [Streptomyces sp. NPDC057428]|uniref:hypothetical protein n=1 Tax=Streptomyces sp. NPDC057428 TaxID=3346129 RepID=UPI0036B5EA91
MAAIQVLLFTASPRVQFTADHEKENGAVTVTSSHGVFVEFSRQGGLAEDGTA